MSEPSSQEPKDQAESNPLDLTDLQSFSFGTQWTDAGKQSGGNQRGDQDRGGRGGRRPQRRSGGEAGRDRRPARRPISKDRHPGEGGGDDRRSRRPRYDNSEGQGGQRGNWRRGGAPERPYDSDIFDVGFYPDDVGFSTIIKALRTNHITYELFEVAKIFLDKTDRFVASVTRKAAPGEKPERVFVSLPDDMPFATEEEAIQHAVSNSVETLFDIEEVEVEAPTGNFQFVNRCGITKALLGPPNYHRYEEIARQHHQSRLSNMPFERFQQSIEQVREEEVINEWLGSMKKTKRYISKPGEGEESQSFDSLSDAIGFLRSMQRDKLVKSVNYARVSGVTLDKYPNTEASRAVTGELARQRRFPLDTANAIRGRLRREKFSIYKKGSKGVTLICSTKRRFRAQGQVMADSLDRLILFLESNQNIKAKELPPAFESWLKETHPDVAFVENKLFQDLHWLIADGYVSHFADDTLFVQPVLENEPKAKETLKKAEPSASASVGPASPPTGGAESTPTKAPEGAASPSESPAETTSEAPSDSVSESLPETKEPLPESTPKAEEVEKAPEPDSIDESADEGTLKATEAVVVEATSESEEEAPVADAETPKTIEATPEEDETPATEELEKARSESEATAEDSADGSDPEPEKAQV